MGQRVSVLEKPSTIPGVVRFEANRVLTGQGHEHFRAEAEAVGPRPAAELARRLFATGRVDGVHLFSNMVTVDLKRGFTADGLAQVVTDLYQYWKPGMEPAVFVAEAPAEGDAAAAADGGAAPAGATDYERLIPAVLIERSRNGLATWKAKQAG
ncbi:MAG: hypothetical protein ACOYL9_12435 [Ilumatobacteraceae bacterium]